jgi:Family of unknown function (DUF6232)
MTDHTVDKFNEERILSGRGIWISNVRLIVDGKTFPMNDVTEVETRESFSMLTPIFFILFAVLVAYSVTPNLVAILGVCIVLFVGMGASRVPRYNVILTTSKGEVVAYSHIKQTSAIAVADAIKKALFEIKVRQKL